MHFAQPSKATLANSLIGALNEFARQNRPPSSFELAVFKRDIERVKKADLAAYYSLLGMLSAVSLDAEGARVNHERALAMTGNGPLEMQHYGVSLMKLYEFDEAIDTLQQALEKDPCDLDILDSLISAAISAGRYRLAAHYVDLWTSRRPDNPHSEAENLNRAIIPFLSKIELPDEDVARVYRLARHVLIERRLYTAEETVRCPVSDEEDIGLALVLTVNESVERVVDAIEDYCEREAEHTPDGSALNVMVSFNAIAA